MAQTRIYTLPGGELLWAGDTTAELKPSSRGLTLILDHPKCSSITLLDMDDLKKLLVDIASAIHIHKDQLCLLKAAPLVHKTPPPTPPAETEPQPSLPLNG